MANMQNMQNKKNQEHRKQFFTTLQIANNRLGWGNLSLERVTKRFSHSKSYVQMNRINF